MKLKLLSITASLIAVGAVTIDRYQHVKHGPSHELIPDPQILPGNGLQCPNYQLQCPNCPSGQECVYPNSGGCEGAGIPVCKATTCANTQCLTRQLPCPAECPFSCRYTSSPCCPFIGEPVCEPTCYTFAPCEVTPCPADCPYDCFYPNADYCCPQSGQAVCRNKPPVISTLPIHTGLPSPPVFIPPHFTPPVFTPPIYTHPLLPPIHPPPVIVTSPVTNLVTYPVTTLVTTVLTTVIEPSLPNPDTTADILLPTAALARPHTFHITSKAAEAQATTRKHHLHFTIAVNADETVESYQAQSTAVAKDGEKYGNKPYDYPLDTLIAFPTSIVELDITAVDPEFSAQQAFAQELSSLVSASAVQEQLQETEEDDSDELDEDYDSDEDYYNKKFKRDIYIQESLASAQNSFSAANYRQSKAVRHTSSTKYITVTSALANPTNCPQAIIPCPAECSDGCIYPMDAPCPFNYQPWCPPSSSSSVTTPTITVDPTTLVVCPLYIVPCPECDEGSTCTRATTGACPNTNTPYCTATPTPVPMLATPRLYFVPDPSPSPPESLPVIVSPDYVFEATQ